MGMLSCHAPAAALADRRGRECDGDRHGDDDREGRVHCDHFEHCPRESPS